MDIDNSNMNESLVHPPTEHNTEAHPESSKATKDERYEKTEAIAGQIKHRRSSFTDAIEQRLPDLKLGETKRQASQSENITQSHSEELSDTRSTLLLVEDNLINQKVLRRQLQGKGFEVSCVHTFAICSSTSSPRCS